jgi:hypothetical protein
LSVHGAPGLGDLVRFKLLDIPSVALGLSENASTGSVSRGEALVFEVPALAGQGIAFSQEAGEGPFAAQYIIQNGKLMSLSAYQANITQAVDEDGPIFWVLDNAAASESAASAAYNSQGCQYQGLSLSHDPSCVRRISCHLSLRLHGAVCPA